MNIDDYPLSRHIAPSVVINIAEMTKVNPDYDISLDDINAWEEKHGKIPEGAAAILYSGRGVNWGDDQDYFDKDKKGEDHYPGFSLEAPTFLVRERHISLLGTDLPLPYCPALRRKTKSGRSPWATPIVISFSAT